MANASIAISSKTCIKCHQEKPIDSFCKKGTNKDGHDNRCRDCQKAWSKKKALSIALLIPVLVYLSGCGESLTPEEEARKYFDVNAKSKCQELVTSRLRSPSTADFPSLYKWNMIGTYDDEEAVTWSYVDAQNAFGGTVRQRFSCTFKKRGGTWEIVDVKM